MRISAQNLQAMIKMAKIDDGLLKTRKIFNLLNLEIEKDKKKVSLKEEKEQQTLNKILSNKIKSVNDFLISKKI